MLKTRFSDNKKPDEVEKYLAKRFCVFEATSRYNAEIGRAKKISHYLGWITDDGLMVSYYRLKKIAEKNSKTNGVMK